MKRAWGMIGLISFLAVCLAANPQTVQVNKENRTILVSATGKASAEADVATIHIGYQAFGSDSTHAYVHGSETSNAIMSALNQAGVPKDAIESDTQSIAETQPYELNNAPPAERTARAFRLQQSWTVKTAAKNANRILDIAVKAGANMSGQIDWSMSDPDALHSKAVEDAMAVVRKNAEAIATGMGVRLGALVFASNDRPAISDRIEQFARLEPPAPPPPDAKALALSPRKIEDSATIYAIYSME